MPTKLLNTLCDFHEDENGVEALQVVMIVAVAAIVLIAVMVLGQDVYDWCINSWLDLSEKSIG